MDEQKLEELKCELDDTNIKVRIVNDFLEVEEITDLYKHSFSTNNIDFLNMQVSNIASDIIAMFKILKS